MENEEVRNKIKKMFISNDPEMIKMARKLCHHLRISYHVVVFKGVTWLSKGYRWYFLDEIGEILKESTPDVIKESLKIYKIDLKDRKNGTTAKVEQEHSQTASDVWKEIVCRQIFIY